MSETQKRKTARWRQSRRHAHGQSPTARAVSPVVATLILILIAVAAAAALYLWLVDWQKGVTGSIGQQQTQPTLLIGGSTSVYPFTTVAVQQFEQNHSDVVVSNSQGGTGAGMLAVCHGQVDIGASSSLQTTTGLIASDGCPSTVTITTVAYDAVDIITSTNGGPTTVAVAGNLGPLVSMNATVLLAIYADTSAPGVTLAPSAAAQAWLGTLWAPGTGAPAWNNIPTSAGCGTASATLQLALGAATCHGVNLAGNVDTVARSDASGTTQSFEARLLGATSATAQATTVAGLGFGGCGSNNLVADCGMTTSKSGNGNPGVISTVAGDKNALGYASDGLVRASGSGVTFLGFAANGQTQAVLATYPTSGLSSDHDGVIPTTGATGTISAGIKVSATVANYAGWRPFEYVTTQPPTGEAAVFINYVLDPANNQNIASETQEVSVYSV